MFFNVEDIVMGNVCKVINYLDTKFPLCKLCNLRTRFTCKLFK